MIISNKENMWTTLNLMKKSNMVKIKGTGARVAKTGVGMKAPTTTINIMILITGVVDITVDVVAAVDAGEAGVEVEVEAAEGVDKEPAKRCKKMAEKVEQLMWTHRHLLLQKLVRHLSLQQSLQPNFLIAGEDMAVVGGEVEGGEVHP